MRAREAYEFAGLTLDVTERRLTSAGRPLHLPPKTFDLLVVLVREAGQLMTKRRLLDAVWPDAHVEEGILSVHVSHLRTLLRGGGDACRIETVPRAGYRLIGDVTMAARRAESTSMHWPIGVLPAQPQVYELIGRGRAHLMTAAPSEIPKAIEAFGAALNLDPSAAAAHAGLARAHCAQAEWRSVPHAQAYADARAAALRALAMDHESADALLALGAVMFFGDWNWTGARRSLERALAIDPHNSETHLVYGRLLEVLGDLDGGVAAKHKALARDPFSALVHVQIALSYWHQRRFDDVIAWASKALAIDPTHLAAREHIAAAYLKKGDADRHMAECLAHAECYGVPSETLAAMRRLYATAGRRGILMQTLQQARERPAAAAHLAIIHAELGDLDAAFDHLDAAIERRDPCLVHLAVAPQWDGLRADPRFGRVLARMGLGGLPQS